MTYVYHSSVQLPQMMFDGAELFKGLTAWFSSSVPECVQSLWVKNGGLKVSDIKEADYIFSGNATAKDTLRIFESQKYQNEELTIFNSSLIEDTVTSGKHFLTGKYTGSYILIHPEYQREMESFHRDKCPRIHRSSIQLATVVDDKKNGRKSNLCSESSQRSSILWRQQANGNEQLDEWDFKDESEACTSSVRNADSGMLWHQQANSSERLDDWEFEDEPEVCTSSMRNAALGSRSAKDQAVDNQSSDEWNFKDESNNHIVTNIREARRLSSKPVDSTKNITCLLPKPHSNSFSQAVTQQEGKRSSTKQQNIVNDLVIKPKVTSLSSVREDRRCLADDSVIDIWNESYSTNADNTNQSRNAMEGKRKQFKHSKESSSQEEERESFLDGSYFKHIVTSRSPATQRSRFLSSMDDGVVHIDDIKLPDVPIDDFIPNHNGCRVDSK